MQLKAFLLFTFFNLLLCGYAEPWARTYHKPDHQIPRTVIPLPDGFLLGGFENQNMGATGGWLIRINFSGAVMWAKESTQISFQNLSEANGNIITGGSSDTLNLWVSKMDLEGNSIWKKLFPDNLFIGVTKQISPTPDNGYFIAGQTNHFGGGTQFDLWAMKLDANGNTLWQRVFDAEGMQDLIIGGEPTQDGGYIVAGYRNFKQSGTPSLWLIKLNASGVRVWEKVYTINSLTERNSIFETSDGGFIVSAKRLEPGKGNDLWILKLNANGNIVWQKGLGGDQEDFGNVYPLTDGYMVVGTTFSYGAGNSDVWVAKMDLQGNIIWQKAYGGTEFENGYAFAATANGRYLIAGNTQSFGSDGYDTWLLDLDQNGNAGEQCNISQNTSAVPYNTFGSVQTFNSSSPVINIASVNSSFANASWDPSASSQCCSLTLSPTILPSAAVNQLYNSTINVFEETAVTYSISSGNLPPGLSLDSITGIISGMPLTAGAYPFEITAADNFDCSGTRSYTIEVVLCIFCDDFEDSILSSQWLYPKGSWLEKGGSLKSTSVRKSLAMAAPAFSGCGVCNVRTSLITSGGEYSRVWILAWHQDDDNRIELLIKESQEKWVLRQRLNGKIVAKKKWIQQIDPGVLYDIAILSDGNLLTLRINGSDTIFLQPSGPTFGTIGFQLKATQADFQFIIVD